MSDLNLFVCTGHIGADANRTHENRVTFKVAVTQRWRTRDNESRSRTAWVRCVCWDARADLAEKFAKKGRHVCIRGEIHVVHDGRDERGPRDHTFCKVNEIQFLDAPEDDTSPPAQGARRALGNHQRNQDNRRGGARR